MYNIIFIFDYYKKSTDIIKNSVEFLFLNKTDLNIDQIFLMAVNNSVTNFTDLLYDKEYLSNYNQIWWNPEILEKYQHLVDELDIQHIILFNEPTDIFNNIRKSKDEINENFAINHPNVKICYIHNKEKIYSGEYRLIVDEKDWLYNKYMK